MPGGLREPFTGVLFTEVLGKSNSRQLVPGFGERLMLIRWKGSKSLLWF
jgi:hypothetical protein